jgi:hypothetical protein
MSLPIAAAALAMAAPTSSDFTTTIDNPYWPMRPGMRWVYREREGGATQRDVVTVTSATRVIQGVTTRAVRDVVTQRGRVVEDTTDYYAQDRARSVGPVLTLGISGSVGREELIRFSR